MFFGLLLVIDVNVEVVGHAKIAIGGNIPPACLKYLFCRLLVSMSSAILCWSARKKMVCSDTSISWVTITYIRKKLYSYKSSIYAGVYEGYKMFNFL
jgi:hypothetical protein